MKLVGNLKKQVEETKNKEEAKKVIEKAGMELTDDELETVAGGVDRYVSHHHEPGSFFRQKFDIDKLIAVASDIY